MFKKNEEARLGELKQTSGGVLASENSDIDPRLKKQNAELLRMNKIIIK